MRVIRVVYKGRTFFAALGDKQVVCLNKEMGLPDPIPLSDVAVLPPVAPTKIICVGLNYRAHAQEMNKPLPDDPLIFLKPPTTVLGAGQAIVMPQCSERVDYEGELAIVIGKQGKNITLDEVDQHIFGYTCANDVTARDLQAKDVQYTRAKGFDTFAPVGPWIETEVPDPDNLNIRTIVNDQVKQEANTSDFIFPVRDVIRFISGVMTLLPGDVILTGTPSGVGPLSPGDEVVVEIDGVGILRNTVVAEPPAKETPIQ